MPVHEIMIIEAIIDLSSGDILWPIYRNITNIE